MLTVGHPSARLDETALKEGMQKSNAVLPRPYYTYNTLDTLVGRWPPLKYLEGLRVHSSHPLDWGVGITTCSSPGQCFKRKQERQNQEKWVKPGSSLNPLYSELMNATITILTRVQRCSAIYFNFLHLLGIYTIIFKNILSLSKVH